MKPRFSPMHRAVSPNPVAAILARSLLSGRRTLHRSLTKPVSGLACSQKKRKLALSSSSKSGSSRREEDVGAGPRSGLTTAFLEVALAGKIPSHESETHPPNLAIRFNSSRRLFLVSIQ